MSHSAAMSGLLSALPPRWAVMWLLAIGIFATCKLVTWHAAAARLPSGATAAYLLAWPGLDASAFARRMAGRTWDVGAAQWAWAIGKTLWGIILIWGGVRLVPPDWPLAVGWAGVVGLGFLLHFGLFHLLALFWRTRGYDVRPLMDAPHCSTSLAEFWSRRWNLAFRDLSHRFILRPLRPRLGLAGATWAVFLFSGLVHDLVISLPAGAGYGLPTLYFLLQSVGLITQRSRAARRWGFHCGFAGWLMTVAFVVGPLPLLFHEPFVMRIVLPFLAAIGAI